MSPLRTRAEAAAWLARLHSGDVSSSSQAACSAWLDESPAHRRALAEATEAWEMAGGLAALDAAALQTPRPDRRLARRAVLAGGVLAVGGAAWLFEAPRSYATDIGQVRRYTLEDGSQAVLDTDSRMEVELRRTQRRVTLTRGRVALTIAPDPERPFVVAARDLRVLALGRVLEVARRGETTSVTALIGSALVQAPGRAPVRLGGGERMRDGDTAAPLATDRPALDQETAWQDNRLVFDDEPLSAAAAEINRYNRRPVRVDPAVGALRVSGVYRAQDADAFAASVAALFGLRVDSTPERVRLAPAGVAA